MDDLVKGGQGRTAEEVQDTVINWGICLIGVAAVLIVVATLAGGNL